MLPQYAQKWHIYLNLQESEKLVAIFLWQATKKVLALLGEDYFTI